MTPRCHPHGTAYLVERVEEVRHERTALAGHAERLHQTELAQIADEGVAGVGAEGERVAPEVPLEGDDGHGEHAGPDHAQGRLSAGETGVEKAQTGHHDQDHGRGDDDVGLVAGLVPLVEIDDICE